MFKKRVYKLKKSFIKRRKKPFIWSFVDIGRIIIDPTDRQSIMVWLDMPAETEERNTFSEHIAMMKPDIFFDIGANYGFYSLLAGKGGVEEIHAFEPNPHVFCMLATNIFLNGLSGKTRLWNQAASDRAGMAKLHLVKGTSDVSTLSPENMPAKWDYNSETTCRTLTLDSLYDFTDKKIFIKIDVEGHEDSALKGMKNLIQFNRTELMIEILFENTETISKIKSYGFDLVKVLDRNYFFRNFEL
jgi:FkbM family methyltransferase